MAPALTIWKVWTSALSLAATMSVLAGFPMFGGEDDDFMAIKRMMEAQEMQPNFGPFRDMPPDIRAFYDQEEGNDYYDVMPAPASPFGMSGPPMTDVYREDVDWPAPYVAITLGEVGGLDTCPQNNVHVFHRADRKWDEDTFDENNNYTHKKDGPIAKPTIVIRDVFDGKVIQSLGANQFYMPHGLTLDGDVYWLTDVATHQVIKYSAKDDKPLLKLGKEFEPATEGNDTERFCQPADVQVSSDGLVFVADGYCNSRIAVFDEEGEFVTSFGEDEFDVPHSLALAEDLDLLCVADRENQVIRLFHAGLTDPDMLGVPASRDIEFPQLGRVFGITYSPVEGKLLAVTQAGFAGENSAAYAIDLHDLNNIEEWTPSDEFVYSSPHAISVTQDGTAAYVGMIDDDSDRKVWKFDRD